MKFIVLFWPSLISSRLLLMLVLKRSVSTTSFPKDWKNNWENWWWEFCYLLLIRWMKLKPTESGRENTWTSTTWTGIWQHKSETRKENRVLQLFKSLFLCKNTANHQSKPSSLKWKDNSSKFFLTILQRSRKPWTIWWQKVDMNQISHKQAANMIYMKLNVPNKNR